MESFDEEQDDNLKPYKKRKILGQGTYGIAFLVQCLSDSKYAVIKEINIEKLNEEKKE